MRLTICALGAAVALLSTPVLAQDSVKRGGELIWAPWDSQQVQQSEPTSTPSPAPVAVRVTPAAVKIVAEVPTPAPEPAVHSMFRMDRFWVIGSFR